MKDTSSSDSNTGVVATLAPAPDGRMRLTLDDVRSIPTLDAITWKRDRLFTYREFDATALKDLNLTREQLAEIGENLVVRLLALRNTGFENGNYRAT